MLYYNRAKTWLKKVINYPIKIIKIFAIIQGLFNSNEDKVVWLTILKDGES